MKLFPNSLIKFILPASMIVLEYIVLFLVPRREFILLFSLFILLFCIYFYIIRKVNFFSFKFCVGLAILLRFIALFSIPALSDDYFRFIWDGQMSLAHVNPFQFTPLEYIRSHQVSPYLLHLYNGMNSQEYQTVYPPVLQYIFAFSAYVGNKTDWGSILLMKSIIVICEVGSMRLLYLLLTKYGLDTRNSLWYYLNPLIIIELTGNVHFESVLIFFFLGFLLFMHNKSLIFSASFWMLSICTKMLPLMLAPLILRQLGIKRFTIFGFAATICGMLLFFPYFNWHLVQNIGQSLGLFFKLFEFNASIFYFIRWLGYFYVDYDIIEQVAPILGIISLVSILCISFWPSRKFSFIEKSLWIFSIYFLFSTMVHPWYASLLIMLSALTKFKFPIVFSILIVLSYFPYSLKIYNEETGLWWIVIEYAVLFMFIIYETFYLRSCNKFTPVE